jgi:recombinational DNA repair protein (RecF pathway)
MYTIHTTDAYILSVASRKESDSLLICISDEYGLMYVNVQGARKEASKHRFIAQPYTFARVTCVEGKVGWRLTGISEIEKIKTEELILPLYIRVGLLINKLVHGEEKGNIYSILYNAYISISQIIFTEENLGAIERIIVLRVLHELGYIGESSLVEQCLQSRDISKMTIEHVRAHKKQITAIINTSLRASGLS